MTFAKLTLDSGVATLSLERADARNALSIDMLRDMHARVDEAAARAGSGEIRVLVLTGAGKSFCAGMDLKQVLSDPAKPRELLSSLGEFTIKLRALSVPTVARVNGAAIGGGCGLVCVCDFAITHADSKMGFPEVDLSVCPAVVAPWLVRKVGPGPARRILLGGGLMSGADAYAAGIVTSVVPTLDALDAAVKTLVDKLVTGGPHALAATKKLLNELDGSVDPASVRRGAELSASVIATRETQEVLRSKLGV
jgi:enoyl-CoA hydratase/carnithine racemase